ncbi:MAG: divalent-cation tolerance protein CutA [Planctomycetaceae bacterium]|nr:divalent-cation tolerance protein CutA [Planctomycetaceae bacterium]
MQYIQLQITFPTVESARDMATKLVQEKLVACAQLCGTVQSIYTWKGVCETSTETLLLAKTALPLFERVESTIRNGHPYECPQIVALPIIAANADYLEWLEEQISLETELHEPEA